MKRRELFLQWYDAMSQALGPCNWWPAETPFEVMVGAVLTQNTAWTNVERAMAQLREVDLLSPEALAALSLDDLAAFIRPVGYYRVKAARLANLLSFLRERCDLSPERLRTEDTDQLRKALLEVKGVGPETADSILLYALERPVFVVDAYTARICRRHGLVPEEVGYDELQGLFTDVLDADVPFFNEFHAQLVKVGNNWCKARSPKCEQSCPLQPFLEEAAS